MKKYFIIATLAGTMFISNLSPVFAAGYQINSDKGKSIASGLSSGGSYKASDGSTWKKGSDGTITVTTKGGGVYNAGNFGGSSSSGGSSSYGGSSSSGGGGSSSGGSTSASIPPQSQAIIDKAKADYEAAKSKGDTAAMNAAHATAQAERLKNGFISTSNGTGAVPVGNFTATQIAAIQSEIAKGGVPKYDTDSSGKPRLTIEIPAVTKDMSSMSASEKEAYITKLKNDNTISSTLNKSGQALTVNMDTFLKYGVITYGDPTTVTNANMSKNYENFKNGEPRYLGYDANGNLVENDKFPRDSDSGKSAELKAWKTLEEIARDPNSMRLAGLTGGTVADIPAAKKTAELFLKQNPQWVAQGYTVDRLVGSAVFKSYVDSAGTVQGQFVMVHTNAAGTWYQSFAVRVGEVVFRPEETIIIAGDPSPLPPGGNYPGGGSGGGSGGFVPAPILNASVVATDKLKSGYGITATVSISGTVPVSGVMGRTPEGVSHSLVKLSEGTWGFPANTGPAAEAYNKKNSTISRQVFVPVMFPDKTDYVITYDIYDASGTLVKTLRSYTYIDGNMYQDDYTVDAKTK